MSKYIASFLSLLLAASCCIAEPQPHAHASRDAAIQVLRRVGIVTGKTRVTDATWNGTFWVITLRDPDGNFPPMDNTDATGLWLRTREGWRLVDFSVGHSDAVSVIWIEQYGVPRELVGMR